MAVRTQGDRVRKDAAQNEWHTPPGTWQRSATSLSVLPQAPVFAFGGSRAKIRGSSRNGRAPPTGSEAEDGVESGDLRTGLRIEVSLWGFGLG